MEECWECHKIISDDEWVVNWGSCSDCMDRSLNQYHTQKQKEEGQDEIPNS